MKKYFWLICVLVLFTACASKETSIKITVPEHIVNAVPTTSVTPSPSASVKPTPAVSPKPTPSVTPSSQSTQIEVAATFLADVPFTPQAPDAIWDELHNEACEEASMIMADAYFHKKSLNQTIAEGEIQKQVAWQTKNGYSYDITADQAARIMGEYYNLSASVTDEVTVANIIYYLQQGKLVIAPFAGRLLKNPYYKQPGPLYHMMIIRGYDDKKKQFITNDPGTRRGEKYTYPYDTILNAIHDWPKPGKTKDDVTDGEMEAGRKVIIVVSDK